MPWSNITPMSQRLQFVELVHQCRHSITAGPHEALGLDTPAAHYTASPRPRPRRLPSPDYAAHLEVRRVSTTGFIKWRGTRLFLTTSLAGEDVSFEPRDTDSWTIAFGPLVLGDYDQACSRFTPAVYWPNVPPHPAP